MFSKVLVANRSEIAVRVARTCRELGVASVAVHSDADARARHVRVADEAVHLPGVAPADTYLNADAIVSAARATGAEAIHPGYGFLSESAAFAEKVADAGLAWVGPPADALRALGDKVSARRIASAAGVPFVPGVLDPVDDARVVEEFAAEYGFPVAVKAAGGGGGRGLKVARSADEIAPAFESARREAQAYFGSADVYVERYLPAPKHLEVQVLAPAPGDALWLGVRDCSLQRRHQKLVEETPPPRWAERAPEMGAAAVALAKASGYVNAGTVEMLVDDDGEFYFLEVNARLQVEHPVTEEVFGVDLVACQLRIASGESLGFTQDDLVARGHAIECRINAEDPARGFAPSPGVVRRLVLPAGQGVRVDAGYDAGDEIPGAYDSLIGKLITRGATRDEARTRMLRALDELVVDGVATTVDAHRLLLEHPEFVAGTHTTRTVEDGGALDALAAAPDAASGDGEAVLLVGGTAVRLWHPAMAGSATAAVRGGAAAGDVVAPMQGTIVKVLVEPGATVAAGDPIVVLEAMKMETTLAAPAAGAVAEVRVAPGDTVAAGAVLAVVE
ncbi:MAG TPA: biotin carboxylase N-terminal domain-containing protein [Actinomycetota bacterium]|nr:biotin carboxylase N-terminal domain-containing protein [Actinomycetota bacterium]